jgi:hypothetical protein
MTLQSSKFLESDQFFVVAFCPNNFPSLLLGFRVFGCF